MNGADWATVSSVPPAPPAEDRPPSRTYRLTRVADVRPRPISWLLPGRIPYGALTILAGRPGTGKSQMTMALAGELSRAGTDALLIGEEDGLEDTVRPRLMAVDADLGRVHAFEAETKGKDDGMTLLPTDVPLLEEAVKETGAGLIIIDPFVAHLSPELNANNDHSLRQATRPLARMARRTGVAVIAVAHFRKSREGSPMDWIGGSGGLTGAARSALIFGRARDEGDDWEEMDKRYLCQVKLNGARFAPTLRCRIEDAQVYEDALPIATSRLVFEQDSELSPWDLA